MMVDFIQGLCLAALALYCWRQNQINRIRRDQIANLYARLGLK